MTKEFKEAAKEMFEQLYTLNVNQYTEKKNAKKSQIESMYYS